MGTSHMVSSGHYLASQAGAQVLENGGNAIDAGVAAAICINIVEPHRTSFSGTGPMIMYLADKREVATIDGCGVWPNAGTLGAFLERGKGDMPIGVLMSLVPGLPDGWLTALELYGTMSFADVVAPALRYAEHGFPVTPVLHEFLANFASIYSRWPSSAAVFMPHGRVPRVGEIFVQKDLANTLKKMVAVEKDGAATGREAGIRAARDFFYKGEVAQRMVGFCHAEGGFLTMDDFKGFHVRVERPEMSTYKSYQVYTCGPFCQGPVALQALNILEDYDLQAMRHNSLDYIHTVSEAFKLAFSDRHHYYGDPAMVTVPIKGLLSKEFARERRRQLDPTKAWPEMPPAGDPWPYQGGQASRVPGFVQPKPSRTEQQGDTDSVCAVDRWGNAFASTFSDNCLKRTPIVPGLGLTISPRGSQFWIDRAHPNVLAPGKRPRLTLNPAMILKDGRLLGPLACPGTDMQAQAMVQAFLNIVEFGMTPQQAVEQPRFGTHSFPGSYWPHSYHPGLLNLEGRFPKDVADLLSKRGHKIELWPDWTDEAGGVCAVVVDQETGALSGVSDPRHESAAAGR